MFTENINVTIAGIVSYMLSIWIHLEFKHRHTHTNPRLTKLPQHAFAQNNYIIPFWLRDKVMDSTFQTQCAGDSTEIHRTNTHRRTGAYAFKAHNWKCLQPVASYAVTSCCGCAMRLTICEPHLTHSLFMHCITFQFYAHRRENENFCRICICAFLSRAHSVFRAYIVDYH